MRPRKGTETTTSPRLVQRFLKRVHHDEIYLTPFFIHSFLSVSAATQAAQSYSPVTYTNVDSSPFLEALCLIPSGGIRMLRSTTYYQACLAFHKRSSTHLALTIQKSKAFWSFFLTVQSRNIWFRLLYYKVSY